MKIVWPSKVWQRRSGWCLMDQRIEHTYTPARANINTHAHPFLLLFWPIEWIAKRKLNFDVFNNWSRITEMARQWNTYFLLYISRWVLYECVYWTYSIGVGSWYTGTNTENDQTLPTCTKKKLTNLVKTEKQLVRKWQQIFLKNWFLLTFRFFLNKSKFQFVRSKFVCVCTSRNVALVLKISSWVHIGMEEDLQFSENRLKRSDWTRRYLKDENKKSNI